MYEHIHEAYCTLSIAMNNERVEQYSAEIHLLLFCWHLPKTARVRVARDAS